MPLQNRCDPFGALVATAARGTMMGNRGGKFCKERGSESIMTTPVPLRAQALTPL